MANDSIQTKIMALSPYVEIVCRRLYWRNVKHVSRILAWRKPKPKPKTAESASPANFDDVLAHLRASGVENGSVLIVHSSFGALTQTGLSPKEINDKLIDFLGEQGTLAMPATPWFRNQPKADEYINEDVTDKVYQYDVRRSRPKTGMLPAALVGKAGAVRSRHPINSMVAFGACAHELMEGNLGDGSPLACGVDSSWKKCVDKDAWIVGLGTDLTHSLTAIHIAEDVLDSKWPVDNWYREKKFHIKDGEFESTRLLRERHPVWGTLHYAERTLCKDLCKAGVLRSARIDGILVEIIRSQELLRFLNARNSTAYPYFWC